MMLKMKQKMEKMQVLNDGADEEDFKELLQILRSFGEVEVLIEIPTAFGGTLAGAGIINPFTYLEGLSAAYPMLNGFSITDPSNFCYNEALARLVWAVHGIGDLVGTLS